MEQLSLAETGFLPKADKQTRKAVFLSEMKTLVQWKLLESLVELFYPKKSNDHPQMSLDTMLLIHFLHQWFGYSDPVIEEAFHEVNLLCQFAELDIFDDAMPDESTILRLHHLLEQNELVIVILTELNATLIGKGLSQTKKGYQWYFGMKAHIGVDANSGLIHTVECTTAKVANNIMLKNYLRGDERIICADRGYHQNNRNIERLASGNGLAIPLPSKKSPGGELSKQLKKSNQVLPAIRSVVEHPCRVIKQQFGFTKVRYRELKKNTGQIVTLFALSNLWMARHRLMPTTGEVRP